MSFLSKIGKILGVIGAVAGSLVGLPSLQALLSPKAQAVETKVVSELGAIGSLVSIIEGAFAALGKQNGTGADKLKAIVPQVAQIIQASELVAGKKLANEALFTQGVTAITSGVADVLNSVQ